MNKKKQQNQCNTCRFFKVLEVVSPNRICVLMKNNVSSISPACLYWEKEINKSIKIR
jgi:hypothetical protein